MDYSTFSVAEDEILVQFCVTQQDIEGLISEYQSWFSEEQANELQTFAEDQAIYQSLENVYQLEKIQPWRIRRWRSEQKDDHLEVKVWVNVLPPLVLPDYISARTLEVPPVPILTEPELEYLLLDLKYQYAQTEPVIRHTQRGDRIWVDMYAYWQEAVLPLTPLLDHDIILHPLFTPAPEWFPALIDQPLGEWFTCELPLPQTYAEPQFRGQKVEYCFFIHRIEALTLLDEDALAAQLGFPDLSGMIQYLHDSQMETNQRAWLKTIKRHLLLMLLEECDLVIPEEFIEQEIISQWNRREKKILEELQLPEEAIQKAEFLWLNFESIGDKIYADLAMSKIAQTIVQEHNITVDFSEIATVIKPLSDFGPVSFPELLENIIEEGLFISFGEILLAEKVFERLYRRTKLICEGEVIKEAEAF